MFKIPGFLTAGQNAMKVLYETLMHTQLDIVQIDDDYRYMVVNIEKGYFLEFMTNSSDNVIYHIHKGMPQRQEKCATGHHVIASGMVWESFQVIKDAIAISLANIFVKARKYCQE